MQFHHIFSSLLFFLSIETILAAEGQGWHFVQNGTSGIVALEAIVVSPTLAVLFDRVDNHDPLFLNGKSVWGALWNFVTNKATPLELVTDSFCASGAILSNGTMVSIGGNPASDPEAGDGLNGLRLFEPCDDPAGVGCTVFENPATHHLARYRWYPSSLRIPDGSLMIIGGNNINTSFYSDNSETSFEFFPPKDGGVPRESPFLVKAGRTNLFPRSFALPDGKVFIIANVHSMIYDIEKKTETMLPDVPNGAIITNPFDGTATLLPLSPPDYIPEVLACGGHITNTEIPVGNRSSQDSATDQCSRITLTPEGIKKGWEVDRMIEPRTLAEMILLPNGQVLMTNGGRSGYAGWQSVSDPVGENSNADHPALTPALYTPSASLGKRWTNANMPTTNIPRLYHSTATLTPMGNIFIGGSNPNPPETRANGTEFQSEFRIEYLNPPYMTVARPALSNVPSKIGFNQMITVDVSIPKNLKADKIQVALMDVGFSSHAFHSSSRLVFMTANLSNNGKKLTIRSPPNNRVFPPGPGFIFLTIDGVTSTGSRVMVGSGATPPVADQGTSL